jgi:hypothetical protein
LNSAVNKIIPKNIKYITEIKNKIIYNKFNVIFSDISVYDDWLVSDDFFKKEQIFSHGNCQNKYVCNLSKMDNYCLEI